MLVVKACQSSAVDPKDGLTPQQMQRYLAGLVVHTLCSVDHQQCQPVWKRAPSDLAATTGILATC